MIIYFVISTVCILITLLQKNYKYALETSFILLTFFFAIRFDFGSDYPQYLIHFDLANQGTIKDALDTERFEDGWVLLCRLCYPIGFFGMVIVLAFFENYVVYRMIKRYVPPKWYWLSLFCYLFPTSLCLTGLSMMRQFLAMCVCLIAFDVAVRKKIFFALLLVLIAAQFHTSAYICLPICFIGLLKDCRLSEAISIGLLLALFIISIFAVTFFGGYLTSFVRGSVFDVYESRFEQGQESVWGVSTFFNYYLFALILLMQRKQDKLNRFFVLIFLLFFVIDAFKPMAPLIDRVGLYFYILFIICMPNAIIKMKDKSLQTTTIMLLLLFGVYGYFSFITSPGWGNTFLEYKTIFSVANWM